MRTVALALFLLIPCSGTAGASPVESVAARPGEPRQWGNVLYVDLAADQECTYLGKTVRLVSCRNNYCTVDVDGERAELVVAKLDLPRVINGVRIFLADNRASADVTANDRSPRIRGALTRDALLALSDPAKPLLDPSRFTFPISRENGFEWTIGENSNMFAYLRPVRSHEGMDINMMRARGKEIDALVAMEDSVVRWIGLGSPKEAAILLESTATRGIYYVYQHLNRDKLLVSEGQKVQKGQKLAYIWGDGRWGHLHFAIGAFGPVPPYNARYQYLLNIFPQMYELWNGDLKMRTPERTSGDFRFAGQYYRNGNQQHLNAYSEVLGYGWRLGDWCPHAKVETSLTDEGTQPDQSARLRKKMHVDTAFPALNPEDYIDFEVAVTPGVYRVRALLGDLHGPTWQHVFFGDADVGVYDLTGKCEWTPELAVPAADGRQTIRFRLKDDNTAAAIRELYFHLSDDL